MKIKNIVTVLLIALILASCAPTTKIVPINTSIPTSTFTPIPPTPTITPTPTPENISDAKDLSVWVNEFVHAYGDKVIINGVEMDARQLTNEIRNNAGMFTQVKEINKVTYSFLIVNGMPLAMLDESRIWEEATPRNLISIIGGRFGTLIDNKGDGHGSNYEKNYGIYDPTIKNLCNLGTATIDAFLDEMNTGTINYEWPDWEISRFNEGNSNTSIRLGALIFPEVIPQKVSLLSKDDAKQLIDNVITSVMKHFKGKIASVVVVNEPHLPHYRENDPFYNVLGEDYIDYAFEVARKANPSVALIFNDFNNHWSGGISTSQTMNIVSRLKTKGLIDAVGLQMHIVGEKLPPLDDITNTIQKYRNLGVDVYITELSIDMTNIPKENQGSIWYQVITAILKGGSKNITIWDMGDKYAWEVTRLGRPNAAPTILDDNYDKKEAYYQVVTALFDFLEKSRNCSAKKE